MKEGNGSDYCLRKDDPHHLGYVVRCAPGVGREIGAVQSAGNRTPIRSDLVRSAVLPLHKFTKTNDDNLYSKLCCWAEEIIIYGGCDGEFANVGVSQ
jgi:hypothetical protein